MRLHLWVASERGEPVGVLAVAAHRTPGGLRYVAAGEEAMFGVVPVSRPGMEREVSESIGVALASHVPRIESLELHWLERRSPWSRSLTETLTRRGWEVAEHTSYLSPWIDLASGGLEGWLSRRSKVFAAELARRRRRLAEMGFERIVTSDVARILSGIPRLKELYSARQVERGGGGYCFDARLSRMIVEAVSKAAPGRFTMATLESPESQIAVALCVSAGGTCSGWLSGFDRGWSRYSPGHQAIAGVVEQRARCGDRLLDLGTGAEPYKDELLDGSRILETWRWHTPPTQGRS